MIRPALFGFARKNAFRSAKGLIPKSGDSECSVG
jgi:hypothetical protein